MLFTLPFSTFCCWLSSWRLALKKKSSQVFLKMHSCLQHDCDWNQNSVGSSQVSFPVCSLGHGLGMKLYEYSIAKCMWWSHYLCNLICLYAMQYCITVLKMVILARHELIQYFHGMLMGQSMINTGMGNCNLRCTLLKWSMFNHVGDFMRICSSILPFTQQGLLLSNVSSKWQGTIAADAETQQTWIPKR